MTKNKVWSKFLLNFTCMKHRFLVVLSSLILFGTANYSFSQIITTIAGTGSAGFSGDSGQAVNAMIDWPAAVYMGPGGSLYIGDDNNNRVRVVNIGGVINTFAGSSSSGWGGDGGLATSAAIEQPNGIVGDNLGNIYFSSRFMCKIRVVDVSNVINTAVGFCVGGLGDGGPADSACLYFPTGLEWDTGSNLYIADSYNHRIRKVDASGIISTIAGTGVGGYSGDGQQSSLAKLNYPNDVAIDNIGNIYIADFGNSRVRKIDFNGNIATVAGNGSAGFSGDMGPATSAQLAGPSGIVLDQNGNLYIADSGNDRIRKVNTSGIITTIAGTGIGGYNGDGIFATSAQLNNPWSLDLDTLGNLYIADRDNNRIRKIDNVVGVNQINGKQISLSLYPNPSTGFVIIEADLQMEELKIYNSIGHLISKIDKMCYHVSIDLTEQPNGVYFLEIKTNEGIISKKLFIQN